MVKMFYLFVSVTLLYAQTVVATKYNRTIDIRDRCETCKAHFSSQNVNLNEIESYKGFDGFLVKYNVVQQYGVDDPELICLLTDMCPLNVERKEEDSLRGLNDFDEQSYDKDLVVKEEPNEIDFKSKEKGGYGCNACKKVYKIVIKKIGNKSPKKSAVKGYFSTTCKHVPKSRRSLCNILIKLKSGKLAKMALDKLSAKSACKSVKACE